jgi:hypothetical protein
VGSIFDKADTTNVRAIADIIESLKTAYPDAKKLHVDIHFEFVETEYMGNDGNIRPVVKIDIER